jgi:hypothetical protein
MSLATKELDKVVRNQDAWIEKTRLIITRVSCRSINNIIIFMITIFSFLIIGLPRNVVSNLRGPFSRSCHPLNILG